MLAPRILQGSSPGEAMTINLNIQLSEGLAQMIQELLTRATTLGDASQFSAFTQTRPSLRPEHANPDPPPPQQATTAAGPQPETLLALYDSLLLTKRQQSASAGTIGDHRTSMRAFDKFVLVDLPEAVKTLHRFSTPVQCLRIPSVLSMWAQHLVAAERRAPFTVSRRLTHVSMLCKAAKIEIEKPSPESVRRMQPSGPVPARRNGRTAAESDSPQEPQADRRLPSFEEIDALARHVSQVRYPYGDHAPYFWRFWVRFLAFIGPRSRDVVSPIARKPGLRRQDIILETLCPLPDVNSALGRELHSPHGWLHYSIGKDHHSDCRRILFPMPKWMRDGLQFWIQFSSGQERIFPASQHGSKALSPSLMSNAWQKLITAAGVDARLIPSEGTGGKIALRKYAANWWHLKTMQQKGDLALADKMAHYVLHHAEVTTSNRHYLAVQAAVLPTMLELMPLWPVPAAGAAPVSLLPE